MKKELSPAVMGALVVATLVLVLGGGFLLLSRTSSEERPSKAEETARFEAAKAYYQGIGAGGPGGQTRPSGPGGGPPLSPEWEARQKSQGQSAGN